MSALPPHASRHDKAGCTCPSLAQRPVKSCPVRGHHAPLYPSEVAGISPRPTLASTRMDITTKWEMVWFAFGIFCGAVIGGIAF